MDKNDNHNELVFEEDLVLKDNIAYVDSNLFTGIVNGYVKLINKPNAMWDSYSYFTQYKNGIKEGVFKSYWEGWIKKEVGFYNNGLREGVFKSYWANGKIKEEGFYNNGIKETVKSWFVNGNKNIECFYKDRIKEGLFKSWFESGNKKEEGVYKDGKKNGIWKTWFDEECELNFPSSISKYDNDELIMFERSYDNGRLESELNKNGITEDDEIVILSRDWYRNGQLLSERIFNKNNGKTIYTSRLSNGRLEKKIVTDTDGIEYIFEREFYKNGIVKSANNYKIGYKVERFLKNGEEIKIQIKIKHGFHKAWFSNGIMSSITNYQDNKKHGNCKIWDLKTKKAKSQIYKNGILIEEKEFFKDYYRHRFYEGAHKFGQEYRKYDGQLLPKSLWPTSPNPVLRYNDDFSNSGFNDKYYNDQLDIDQQGPEFWDSL